MQIGDYITSSGGIKVQLTDHIGSGSFGKVYLAVHDNGEQYAVKVIMPVADEQAELSFRKELNAAEGLDHDNLLIPIDHGEVTSGKQRGLFVIYPYCPDGSYRVRLEKLKKERASLEVILSDFDQILAGLSVLHTQLVHRDLKPENVMVDGSVLKIGDFGLTKFVDDATQSLTFKGSGTPMYMAPEVWLRQQIGIPADLYAIGVMLYEALIGEPPFKGKDSQDLQHQHLYEPAPRAGKLRPDISLSLDGVIKKLLQKESKQRFQSASDVREALQTARAANASTNSSVVEAMKKHHDIEEQKHLEAQQKASQAIDTAALNKYMEQQVLDMFEEVVNEINAVSPETQIHSQSNGKVYTFGNRKLDIEFFALPVEIHDAPGHAESLRNDNVQLGAGISIEQGGEIAIGWNLILFRPPESNYGYWQHVAVSMSAFAGKRFFNGTAPIDARELTRAYSSRRAMDIYQIREHALEKADVEMMVQHLIPTLIQLTTKSEEERKQRAFEDRLSRRQNHEW